MCGIFGIVNFSGEITSSDNDIKKACAALNHRGPDESGIFKDQGVILAHTRLSIIDIGGGKQPMSTEDKNITITYNGEIYNFEEIRDELLEKGHSFTTKSDTEVLLKSYIEYGEQCFNKFNGMFAVAVWDKNNKTLILSRDRMGKKPLYYAYLNNIVVFASELKAIYALNVLPKEIDKDSLQDYFTFGYIPTPKSIYKNILKLEPASYSIINQSGIKNHQYWDLKYKLDPGISFTDARSQTKSLLEKSVHDRLVSDVPFGAFLSGGIDSSVVVSIMQRYLENPVKTFSIGFDVSKYNELDDAKLISKHIGTDHTEYMLTNTCTDIVTEFTSFYDEPFGDSSSLPTYFVSKLASSDVKMVLTGDGGDEVFGGYSRYSRHMFNNMVKKRLPFGNALSNVLNKIPHEYSRKAGKAIKRAINEYPLNYLQEVALSNTNQVRELINANGSSYDSYNTFAKLYKCQDTELNSIYYGDMKSYMLDDILVKIDRMSMANSIELRSPFLDVNLLEYSAKLPESYKTSIKMGKLILRDIAEDYVPKEIIYNKKKGFGIPLKEWFKHDLKDMLCDLLESNRNGEILNYELVDRLIDEHTNDICDNSEVLWLVLCFEIWNNEYNNT